MATTATKYIVSITITIALLWSLFGPVPAETLWWREALNSGHTVLFFVLALLVCHKILHYRGSDRPDTARLAYDYGKVLLICLLLSISIELLQALADREVSLHDVYRSMLGALAGMSLRLTIDSFKTQQQKSFALLYMMTTVIFLTVGLATLLKLSVHYVERSNAFPVVMEFGAEWSESFVRHQQGDFAGIHIIEPEPNWLGYESLTFDVESQNLDTIKVGFRVHDYRHNNEHDDRFNSELIIKPGRNSFEFPLDEISTGPVERRLDLSAVTGVILFSKKSEEWERIEVRNLKLK